jgi:TPR repeat protein
MYSLGHGVTQSDAQAAAWTLKAATQGNPTGQRNLGWAYENGRGLRRDIAQAKTWYEKAAAQGDVKAKAALQRIQLANSQPQQPGPAQSRQSAAPPASQNGEHGPPSLNRYSPSEQNRRVQGAGLALLCSLVTNPAYGLSAEEAQRRYDACLNNAAK